MTSKKGTIPKFLKAASVREIVEEALASERYQIGDHATLDHPEREIDFNDILFGLRQPWKSCLKDEFDSKNWQWKYKIKTEDVEGRSIVIVLRLSVTERHFFVITRYPDD